MLTVLSQNTNDRNRDVAYGRLRERFGSWEDVRAAPVAEVEEAIRPGGLAPTKAVRIVNILRRCAIAGDDLWPGSPTRRCPRPATYLCDLPGVGRKTAACVLLFSFGRHDVPVDTHVYRVGTRLGPVPAAGAPRGGPRRDAAALTRRATPTRCTCCSSATAGARARPAARVAASARSCACVPRVAAAGRRHERLRAPAARRRSRRPVPRAIAALKGLTVEIDTFHGTDAGLYHLPTIRQFADHVDLSPIRPHRRRCTTCCSPASARSRASSCGSSGC